MMEQLLTSSVLILAIVLIRLLLRGRLSARLQYGLWLLAALRLLIPGSLLAQPWSALSLAQDAGLPQAVETVRYETQEQSVYGVLESGETPVEYAARMEDLPWLEESVGGAYRIAAAEEAEPGEVRLDLEVERDRFGWLRMVWYAGMAAMGLWFLLTNLLFGLRLRRTARPAAVPAARPVYTADLPSPCVWGLFRPRIYVTADSLADPRQLRHVLAHEEAHLRHGDQLWSLVRCACLVIWWFHPLVWLAAALSRRDCELAADEAAIRRLGEGERLAYGRTLLDVVAQKAAPGTLLQTATTMHSSVKQLRARVTRIASARPMQVWSLAAALLLAALAVGCAFGGVQNVAEEAQEEETQAPEMEQVQTPDEPEVLDETSDTSARTAPWRRYPGEYYGEYPDLHVEDSQGNDISAELIDLWYASSAVYNVDDRWMFDMGESRYNGNYVELKDYDQVVSAIFTENGRNQLELTYVGNVQLLIQEDGKVYRKTGWKTGYFYGAALKNMTVLTAEEDRLTLLVEYQRDQGLVDVDPTYDTLEWVVVREDGLWKVDSYPYPEDTTDRMLYAMKGTYTDDLGNETDYFYEVPLLQADTEGAKAINQAIRDGMGEQVAYELECMEAQLSVYLREVSYRNYGYRFVSTLVLKAESVHEFTNYAVYHYDQETGQALTNEELLKKVGVSQERYLSALRKAAEQAFLASVPDVDIEILGGQAFYDQQYAFTMSEDNLNMDTMMYWDYASGGLCAIVPIGAFAGAGWYYHVLPLELQ